MPRVTWIDSFFQQRSSRKQIWLFFVILFILIANTLFLISQGGVPSAFAHIMYVPILLAAFFLNTPLTIMVALLSSSLSGPLLQFVDVSYYNETFQASMNRLFSLASWDF